MPEDFNVPPPMGQQQSGIPPGGTRGGISPQAQQTIAAMLAGMVEAMQSVLGNMAGGLAVPVVVENPDHDPRDPSSGPPQYQVTPVQAIVNLTSSIADLSDIVEEALDEFQDDPEPAPARRGGKRRRTR
jgi:hypothetical protein